MDFDLNDDQRLLQDSVTRLLSDRYNFEMRKRYLQEPEGWSTRALVAYAELGLLGLASPRNMAVSAVDRSRSCW